MNRSKNSAGERSRRINLLIIFIFILAGLVFAKLFYVSYFKHDSSAEIVEDQFQRAKDFEVRRGDIYVKSSNDGDLLNVAVKGEIPYVYIIPEKSENPLISVELLNIIMPSISKEDTLALLSKKDDPFEIIKKRVSQDVVEKVKSLNMPDIKIGYENGRVYSKKDSMAHLLGFLGFQDGKRVGQYGIESFYDEELKEERDYILTIDYTIQSKIEESLENLVDKWDATSGSIIIQDPKSGAILAMTSSPSYDPNHYNKYSFDRFINPVVQDIFEPGSSMKTITMAAGIDQDKVTPSMTYEDKGYLNFGEYTIKNYDEKVHGIKTMTQVLEKSLNTGAVFVQKKVGDEAFLNYLINFGFGKKTDIDLSGELDGNISNLYTGREINFVTASYGQGIAVTPIQLINAYSAIANDGKLMKPYIVDEILYPEGKREKTKSKIINIPISQKTSSKIKTMLVSVVENGFDKVSINGYDIAAKTGTAQIAEPGGYSEDFIHDMVGFAPAFSPRFTILIKLDKPQDRRFASDTLSETFKDITKFLLNYYNIPPTK